MIKIQVTMESFGYPGARFTAAIVISRLILVLILQPYWKFTEPRLVSIN